MRWNSNAARAEHIRLPRSVGRRRRVLCARFVCTQCGGDIGGGGDGAPVPVSACCTSVVYIVVYMLMSIRIRKIPGMLINY
jgi:hypothetical protein